MGSPLAHSLVPVSIDQGWGESLLKKGPLKTPDKNQLFCGPHHNKKRGSYRNSPMGDSLLQTVTNRFPQAGENRVTEAPEVIFDLTQGDEGLEPLLPMTP